MADPPLLVPPPPPGLPIPPQILRKLSDLSLSSAQDLMERKGSFTAFHAPQLNYFQALEIRRQLTDFYMVYDPSKLNVSTLDKFMLFIEQHSYETFNQMLFKKYGASLETHFVDASLQRAIEQFYHVHDPSKITGLPLFLDFIKANGLVAFNQMLLKKYGAMLPALQARDMSSSSGASGGNQLDQLEQPARSPGFDYSPEEWTSICDKLHSFYLRRDKSKLSPTTLNKFQEFIRAKGVGKFNDMLWQKYGVNLDTPVLEDQVEEDEPEPVLPAMRISTDPSLASEMEIKQLDFFFKLNYRRAPPGHAKLLLTCHKWLDVALAIRATFKTMPPTWRSKLDGLLSAGHLATPRDIKLSDRKLDEIIDTEESFIKVIEDVQAKYVTRLNAVLANVKDKEGIKALGLSQNDVRQIFSKLDDVVLFSRELLVLLDVVNWCRTPPVTGEGRSIHAGRAFVTMAPKISHFAPVVALYNNSLKVLVRAENDLKPSSKGGQSFLAIWDSVTEQSDLLRGKKLQSVLITPVQRVPRYKLLLEQLVKDCDSAQAIPVVTEALELVSEGAMRINESVRTYEKMESFLGSEDAAEAVLTGKLMR